MRPTPTRGKRARAAETAAATAEFAPRREPTRRAREAVIRSIEAAAHLFEQGGDPPNPAMVMPVSAARCRARAAEMRAALENG